MKGRLHTFFVVSRFNWGCGGDEGGVDGEGAFGGPGGPAEGADVAVNELAWKPADAAELHGLEQDGIAGGARVGVVAIDPIVDDGGSGVIAERRQEVPEQARDAGEIGDETGGDGDNARRLGEVF